VEVFGQRVKEVRVSIKFKNLVGPAFKILE
jgi:hypothetical protein